MVDKFSIGVVQTRSTKNSAENLDRAIEKIREAAARGAQIVCLHELFRSEYFCRTENPDLLQSGRADSRPGHRSPGENRAKRQKVVIVASLFERRAAGIYHNTCAVLDADGSLPRQLPQDAHPRRSALLREILFHARRSGFPDFRHAIRRASACRSAGTSGIRRARASLACGGAQVIFYPTSHRLASRGEGGVRRGAARRLAYHPARATLSPTASTWRSSTAWASRESRRRRCRHRILGKFFRRRSLWRSGRARPRSDKRGNSGRRVRPQPHRGRPPQLALPARPPHRRLSADSQSLARRMKSASRLSPAASLPTPFSLGYRMPAEWEPHARHLARLAARAHRLARKIRAHPVGLR